MQTLQKEEVYDPADRRGVSGLTKFDGEDIRNSLYYNQRC